MARVNAEYVKLKNPILTVLARYGLTPDKKGFLRCPFHSEKTASFKVYPETNSFHCFGCGATGDVIDLTCRIEQVGFTRAVELLGGADITFSQQRKAAQIKRKQEQQAKHREEVKTRYWRDFDRLKQTEDEIAALRPKTPEEEPSPQFLSALGRLSGLQYALEQSEKEVMSRGF